MTMRNNPFAELERLFDRMAQQIADASQGWDGDGPTGSWVLGPPSMRVDVADRGEQFVATADLPGFEREEVDVYVSDEMLQIRAEHEEAVDESDEEYVRRERRQRRFHRSIDLPEAVEEDGVKATMKNGVLTVTLPKAAIEEARHVEIAED